MAFHDETPLRQEESSAMAERIDRLIDRNTKLELARAKEPSIPHVLVLLGLAVFSFFCGIMSQQPVPGDIKPKRPPANVTVIPERNADCYFVRHSERKSAPWDPWYVLRSPCQHCENEFMFRDGKCLRFDTQIEAWNFIKKWDVPMCGMER